MDYLVYVDGAIKQSGVFGIGGDHVTNDICMGLRIPIGRADRLKLDEGSAILGNCLPGETLYLPPEPGFAGREIERETLNSIIHFRLREAFELLKRQLETEPYLRYLGAGVVLTGGCSLIHGINHLAEEILGLPVQPAQPPPLQGRHLRVLQPAAFHRARPHQIRPVRTDGATGSLVLGAFEGPLFGGRAVSR